MKKSIYLLSLSMLLLGSCAQPSTPETNISTNNKTLVQLEVINQPNKTIYYEGESFSKAGLKLLAKFNDESSLTPSNKDIVIYPQGSLTLGTKKVTATYLDKCVDIPIEVKTISLYSMEITQYPFTTTYSTEGYYDFTGLEINATTNNGKKFTLNSNEYYLSINNFIVNSNDKIYLDRGTYNVDITAYDYKVSFPIQIVKGYKIEAENVLYSDPSEDVTSFVRIKNDLTSKYINQPNAYDNIRAINDSTADYASNKSYLGDITYNNLIDFYFYVHEEQMANIAIRASSCYLINGNEWNPIAMGDEQINRLFNVKCNQENITIDDNAFLPGGESKDGNTDLSLWVNWKTVNLADVKVVKGWNIVSFQITSDYVNYLGYYCSFNLDYLSIDLI